jgi:hypothetical protein
VPARRAAETIAQLRIVQSLLDDWQHLAKGLRGIRTQDETCREMA